MAASNVHAAVQANIAHELRTITEYRIYTELSILIDGVEYKPDISAYPYKKLDKKHDIIKMEQLPLSAIEIVFPTQLPQAIVAKIELYLNAGIQSCWMVLPYPTAITVYTADTEQTFIEGNIVDPVLGIELPLKNVFY